MLNDPQDPRNNPANFDTNLDGFIARAEYETLLCKDSFDHQPPPWNTLGHDSIVRLHPRIYDGIVYMR